MPSQNRPSFWLLVKELFPTAQDFAAYIKRNKVASFLILLNALLLIITIFMSEQTVQKTKDLVTIKKELLRYKALTDESGMSNCMVMREAVETDYRHVNKLLAECINTKAIATPKPPKKSPKKPPAAIVSRPHVDDDEAIRKKLDSIR